MLKALQESRIPLTPTPPQGPPPHFYFLALSTPSLGVGKLGFVPGKIFRLLVRLNVRERLWISVCLARMRKSLEMEKLWFQSGTWHSVNQQMLAVSP